jgi:hypothetical protein
MQNYWRISTALSSELSTLHSTARWEIGTDFRLISEIFPSLQVMTGWLDWFGLWFCVALVRSHGFQIQE